MNENIALPASSDPTPKKRSKRQIALFGCAGLLGLCVILGIIGAIVDTSSEDDQGDVTGEVQDSSVDESEAKKEYQESIESISGDISESIGDFRELLSEPQYADPDWRADMAEALGTWKASNTIVARLDPPSGYETYHNKFLQSTESLDQAADDAARGLDTSDLELIESAANHLDEAGRLVNEANANQPWD